jgi:hypothetical protein
MGCRTDGVIAATSDERERKREDKECTTWHDPWYRGHCNCTQREAASPLEGASGSELRRGHKAGLA